MSGHDLYTPDQQAVDTRWIQPWSEAFRAQRDVGLRVPINFHTVPAVSLTRACFSTNQYEHNAFQKCMSNLLAVGFRQFTVDTYWDPLRSVWSLCPVELPQSSSGEDDGDNGGNDEDVSVETGPTVRPSTNTMDAKIPESTAAPDRSLAFERRQEPSTSASANVPTSSAQSSILSGSATSLPIQPSSSQSGSSSFSSASPTEPTIINFPTTNGPPLLQIGNYNCTSLMTLDLLTGILSDFLDTTSTTTGAAITMFTFDIHAASSLSDPDGPAPSLSGSQLPNSDQLLSGVLRGNLSGDTFTPARLMDQRADLNDSWYDVSWANRPLQGYYTDTTDAEGQLSTLSGWPTESYMEFQELFRLVSSYGTIDPQMRLYNIGPDLEYIFPRGTLENQVATTVDSFGSVTAGCLFLPTENTVTQATNSSWAFSTVPSLDISADPDLMEPIPSIANLTSCGITPFLNETLVTTADKNPLPYAAYVHSTLWSFAPGQPLNATDEDTDASASGNRCVVMMKSPYPGRWRVADCGDSYRVACHKPSQPYDWRISDRDADYNDAEGLCPDSYQFSIPHTALENSHLLAAFEAAAPNEDAIFVNMNSLSVPDCWVIGLNGTCPYLASTDTNRTRIVVVPTVAAVIIFVLAALTFFVKCAANRRENKRGRKRRIVDGWEYEGVPS